jgi:hypothetical protein
VYKREGSPNRKIESQHLGQRGVPFIRHYVQAEMKTLEQKWRQEIYDRAKLCKAPTITIGEAYTEYYETTLQPGGKRRDDGAGPRIPQADQRRLWPRSLATDISRAQVAKWRDELVTNLGLIPSRSADAREIAFLAIEACIKLLDAVLDHSGIGLGRSAIPSAIPGPSPRVSAPNEIAAAFQAALANRAAT